MKEIVNQAIKPEKAKLICTVFSFPSSIFAYRLSCSVSKHLPSFLFGLAFLLPFSFLYSMLPGMSPFLPSLSLSLEFCVECTTVEFVLRPLIRLVLIFLPLSSSSAEWMNFFHCLSEAHLRCSAQWLRGLLPAIYYKIKINGCWNVILWPTIIETNDDFRLNRIWNVNPNGELFYLQKVLLSTHVATVVSGVLGLLCFTLVSQKIVQLYKFLGVMLVVWIVC